MQRPFCLLYIILALIPINVLGENSSSPAVGEDYSASFSFRGRPVGATITGEWGYGLLLWQKKDSPSASFLYGFLRPYFRPSVTFVWNQLDGGLQISPVAPIVFSFGQAYNFRLIDSRNFDCDRYECRGVLSRSYLEIKGGLKIAAWFALLSGRYELLKIRESNPLPFADEMSVLTGNSQKDQLSTYTIVSGYDLTGPLDPVMLYSWSRMQKSRLIQQHFAAGAQYQMEPWSIALTVGFFNSPLINEGITVMGIAKWTGKKKISLF